MGHISFITFSTSTIAILHLKITNVAVVTVKESNKYYAKYVFSAIVYMASIIQPSKRMCRDLLQTVTCTAVGVRGVSYLQG